MKERPILFSAQMVRALLDGSKTQTRRIVKPQPGTGVEPYNTSNGGWNWVLATTGHGTGDPFPCPYGKHGDRLWVRETWQTHCDKDGITPCDLPRDSYVQYPATYDGWVSKKRPSIHMPRWASRINLEITGVRVERLQDISEVDAIAEGVVSAPGGMWTGAEGHAGTSPAAAYALLWESINGAGSWDANPWVWVVEFKSGMAAA